MDKNKQKQNTVENLTIGHTNTKLNESIGSIAKAIKKTYGTNTGYIRRPDAYSENLNVKGKIASKIYGQHASENIKNANRYANYEYDSAKQNILSGKEAKRNPELNKTVYAPTRTVNSVVKAIKNREEAEKQGLTPKEFRTKKYEETVGPNRDANEAIRRAQLAKKNKEEKEKMESSGPKSNFVRSLFKKKVGK